MPSLPPLLLQDNPLLETAVVSGGPGGGRLQRVVDCHGREVDRSTLAQREQTVSAVAGTVSVCVGGRRVRPPWLQAPAAVGFRRASPLCPDSQLLLLLPTLGGAAPPPPPPSTTRAHLQLLCECLVYACCIQPRLPAADLCALSDLLHHLALRARGLGAGAALLAQQQQAYLVLLALLLTLLPLENAEGGEKYADYCLLRELAGNRELDAKLGGAGGAAADEPHAAVVRLAWGTLLSVAGAESAAGEAGVELAPTLHDLFVFCPAPLLCLSRLAPAAFTVVPHPPPPSPPPPLRPRAQTAPGSWCAAPQRLARCASCGQASSSPRRCRQGTRRPRSLMLKAHLQTHRACLPCHDCVRAW